LLFLNQVFFFPPNLKYFTSYQLQNENGKIIATPFEGRLGVIFPLNLIDAQAFIELPAEQNNFARGRVYRIWRFE